MRPALLALLLILTLAVGCQRSRNDVWEDTKTAGRYVGKGFASLWGKHGESREIQSADWFTGPGEEEFVPLRDGDFYRQICMGDPSALGSIDADTAIPQAREMPGEIGSGLPGIDGFNTPNSPELIRLFKNVQFETDDYTIRGTENLAALRRIAEYMERHPDLYVFVEGHCDERGPAAYNLSLGARRANAIRNQLIKEGVSLDRLFTISYGKERPIAQGHDEESWGFNRRGQFKVHFRAS